MRDLKPLAVTVAVGIVISAVMFAALSPSSKTTYTHGVPNLQQVDSFVWRSGQPITDEGWDYLKSLGITTVVKLNYDEEGSDEPALTRKMVLIKLAIPPKGDLASVLEVPDTKVVASAVDVMSHANASNVVLVHCTHGQDRTGLVVGAYRATRDQWRKSAAYREMRACGFHPELVGLLDWWEDFDGTLPQLTK
jgi:protein tyrosine/serine phosphatase